MERNYMIEYRKSLDVSIQSMARRLKISKDLLTWLEENDQEVTHPNIAKRIGKMYKLTKEQTESLMPEHYRKSSPNYNPDLYRRQGIDYKDF